MCKQIIRKIHTNKQMVTLPGDLIISVCEFLTIYEINHLLFDCGNVGLRKLIEEKYNKKWLKDHHVITEPHDKYVLQNIEHGKYKTFYRSSDYHYEGNFQYKNDKPIRIIIPMPKKHHSEEFAKQQTCYVYPADQTKKYTRCNSNIPVCIWNSDSHLTWNSADDELFFDGVSESGAYFPQNKITESRDCPFNNTYFYMLFGKNKRKKLGLPLAVYNDNHFMCMVHDEFELLFVKPYYRIRTETIK